MSCRGPTLFAYYTSTTTSLRPTSPIKLQPRSTYHIPWQHPTFIAQPRTTAQSSPIFQPRPLILFSSSLHTAFFLPHQVSLSTSHSIQAARKSRFVLVRPAAQQPSSPAVDSRITGLLLAAITKPGYGCTATPLRSQCRLVGPILCACLHTAFVLRHQQTSLALAELQQQHWHWLNIYFNFFLLGHHLLLLLLSHTPYSEI